VIYKSIVIKAIMTARSFDGSRLERRSIFIGDPRKI